MSPTIAIFLLVLLGAASYGAGRLHGQLSYRFGYRQGYFDGDRAAWNRRRREAQAAIASVLAAHPVATPVLDSRVGGAGSPSRSGPVRPVPDPSPNVAGAESDGRDTAVRPGGPHGLPRPDRPSRTAVPAAPVVAPGTGGSVRPEPPSPRTGTGAASPAARDVRRRTAGRNGTTYRSAAAQLGVVSEGQA